jgi:uncharacterized protein (TIRG00374 family)
MIANLRGKLLFSLAFGIAVLLGLGVYADLGSTVQALAHFEWRWLPAIVGLTVLNYVGRFCKWQYYLRCIGSDVRLRSSAAIFVAGLSMVMTPGKVGELLKAYLLKRVNGTPIARSAPIVIAERLTDGIALLLLGSVGLALYGLGWRLMVAIALLATGFVVAVRSRHFGDVALATFARLPLIGKRVTAMRVAYESTHSLLEPRRLALAIGIGILSWSGECIAFALVLHGLRVASPLLIVKAAFILAASTIVGSASLLPGGLGVAEGGITVLLKVLVTADTTVAVAATVMIRLCTLWFGAAIGVATLALFTRKLESQARLVQRWV